MMKWLRFYSNVVCKILKRDVIDSDDYRIEYNKVAGTYNCWTDKMGKYTDKIIKSEYLKSNEKIKDDEKLEILDFACGTGYITKKLLGMNINCKITAVDISKNMLEKCNENANNIVKTVNMDGIEFLKQTNEKFDIIFCGWALPYFNHKVLLKLFKNVLNEDGIVAVISNSKGTLANMEEVFIKVMKENQNEILKPMNITFQLPNGKKELKKWFNNYSFTCLEIDEEEVVFLFEEPEQLLDWINKTGAVAGTAKIFRDYNNVKDSIIQEINKKNYNNGKYVVNHKFIHGIFKKS